MDRGRRYSLCRPLESLGRPRPLNGFALLADAGSILIRPPRVPDEQGYASAFHSPAVCGIDHAGDQDGGVPQPVDADHWGAVLHLREQGGGQVGGLVGGPARGDAAGMDGGTRGADSDDRAGRDPAEGRDRGERGHREMRRDQGTEVRNQRSDVS